MPLLRKVGEWLMLRGISPGEPGWHLVPIIALIGAPLTLALFAVAIAFELVVRLDFRRRLGPTAHWALAVALATAVGVLGILAVTLAAS